MRCLPPEPLRPRHRRRGEHEQACHPEQPYAVGNENGISRSLLKERRFGSANLRRRNIGPTRWSDCGQVMRFATSRDSTAMLAALGTLAFAASMMTHEALGHGGYCLAVGGHNTLVTPWSETCHFPALPRLGIKVAGPGVQFSAGLLAWLALHRVPPHATRLRYFLWLCMTLSLFISSGYVAFSGILNAGDAAEVVAPLHGPYVWRGIIILLGSTVYFLSMWAAAFELRRFASSDDGMHRIFRLVWVPYASVGAFTCCTIAMNRIIGHGVSGLGVASPGLSRTVGLAGLALASSFGAGSGMFGLPPMVHGRFLRNSSPAQYVKWSTAWGTIAGAVFLLFLFSIGPGLH